MVAVVSQALPRPIEQRREPDEKKDPASGVFKKFIDSQALDIPSATPGLVIGKDLEDEIKGTEEVFHHVSSGHAELHLGSVEVLSTGAFEKDLIDEIFTLVNIKQKAQDFKKQLKTSDSFGLKKSALKILKTVSNFFKKATKATADGLNAFSAKSGASQSAYYLGIAGLVGSSAAGVAMLAACSMRLHFHLKASSSLSFVKPSKDAEETDRRYERLVSLTKVGSEKEASLLKKILADPKVLRDYTVNLSDADSLTMPHPISEESKAAIAAFMAQEGTHLTDKGKELFIKIIQSTLSSEIAKEAAKVKQQFNRAYGKEVLEQIQKCSGDFPAKNSILSKARKALISNIISSILYTIGALMAGAVLIMGKLVVHGGVLLAENIMALAVFTCTLAVDLKKTFSAILAQKVPISKKIVQVLKKLLLIGLGVAGFLIARTGADTVFSAALAVIWAALLLYTVVSIIGLALRKK